MLSDSPHEFVFFKTIVESDSSRVIDCLSNARSNSSYFNDIIEDCHLMSRDFEEVFSSVGRTRNRVALDSVNRVSCLTRKFI